MTDAADGTDLRVVRWRRYGHDRLYVNTADGSRVGWLDLQTGVPTLDCEEHRAAFERAIRDHHAAEDRTDARSDGRQACVDDEGASEIAGSEIQRPWVDLAGNRPGEQVAREARKAFAEAPVRVLSARLFGLHTKERAWRLGAKGESLVGKQLGMLGKDWYALHSIPVGTRGSDIDHLAIGPGGAFTINAKTHPQKQVYVHRDTFMVDGFRQPYVRNARHEADRAHRLLSEAVGWPVPVVGLIAVIGAHKGFTVKEQPRDGRVVVLARKTLADWLSRLGPLLETQQVESVYEVARRSTTWVPSA